MGYTNIYAPTLDVSRDQRWGRVEDTYGEDPYLASRLGVEMVKGLQENYTVASTAKHFAVYSVGKGSKRRSGADRSASSPREVENILLPPFKAAIKEAGLLGVMSSYNDFDSIPVTGSEYWLTDRLRKDFGFQGLCRFRQRGGRISLQQTCRGDRHEGRGQAVNPGGVKCEDKLHQARGFHSASARTRQRRQGPDQNFRRSECEMYFG